MSKDNNSSNRTSNDDDDFDSSLADSLLWCRDLHKHSLGEYSFAIVQANEVIEDQSQVETAPNATFVGVYDGHGGPDASRYICDHLFLHLVSESLILFALFYYTSAFVVGQMDFNGFFSTGFY